VVLEGGHSKGGCLAKAPNWKADEGGGVAAEWDWNYFVVEAGTEEMDLLQNRTSFSAGVIKAASIDTYVASAGSVLPCCHARFGVA
jgi:hypothetical protein